ncbi:MAG: hypothetical protein U0350_09455 [Caldilineaceae bacterium]
MTSTIVPPLSTCVCYNLLASSLVRVALRPEYPPPPTLLGYAAYREQALTTLHAGKSVHLCGPGGIGKTSLGATILGQLAPAPVFWYTFRPTLNDRIGSLLFLWAIFYTYKASHLWQLVVAAGGIIEDYQLALALLRQDVALLAPHPPAPVLTKSTGSTAPMLNKLRWAIPN